MTEKQEMASEGRGWDWSDASVSQGLPATPEAGREDWTGSVSERTNHANILIVDS